MQRTVCFSFVLSLILPVAAQQQPISNQQVFKTEDGLPQSFVSGVVEDKDGFIWVGTQDGLARYDGRSFKIISRKETGGIGFRSHVITSMACNENNHLTILYQGGNVDDFDPVNFSIKPVSGGKRKLPQVRQGIVRSDAVDNLLNFAFKQRTGSGVDWTDPVTGKDIHAGISNGKLQNDTICGMTRDREGNIIILTPSGAEISRNGGESFEHTAFRIPFDSTIFYFKDVLVMPDQSLVMRYKNALIRINIPNKSVTFINTPARDLKTRALANFITLDHKGRLYFEQLGGVYRLEDDQLKLLWQSTASPELNITACFIDRNDVLWVSPNAQGLIKVNLLANAFQSYNYNKGFFADVLEQAGIPSANLPSYWFSNKRHYNFYTAYGTDSLLYLCYGRADSTKFKQNVFYRDGQKLIALPFPAGKNASFRGITISNKNEVWIADAHNKGLWHWKDKSMPPQFFQFDTTGNFRVIADIQYHDEKIWISTHGNGLLLFENGKLQVLSKRIYDTTVLPDNLTDICINPSNPRQFWIGSRGEGLILFDTDKGVRKIFTTEDGLPNNTIYCIVADRSGMLWLSTNKGICRFNPADFTSTYYVKTDGLAGNEFNRYHKFIFTDGRIAFGGLEGFSVFAPSSFTGKKEPLPVPLKITHIEINNIPQDFTNPKALVNTPFNQLKELTLPYNKNYLSIEFAATQFNEPMKIQYRYMLKGADETWHESGTSNIATYTQLRPGKYILRMNATGLNGIWSNEILELPITIRPPFWATWWAYVIYMLAAALLVRLYLQYHRGRLKEQQQRAYEQKESERLKELDEIKDRFFSNITHEFRTPLTLILTPLEKLKQDPTLPEKTTASLKTISRNANQLLQLVNEFLDFSKLNKGQMKLTPSHGELSSFTAALVQRFNPAAEEKDIQLNYSTEGVKGIYLFDEEKWEKILFNLLSNALKFTDPGGTVNVVLLKKENNEVVLKVMDSGIGIPSDQLSRIFDRFYQVDSSDTRHHSGTGIGLALVKELVELMGGTIRAESVPGKGSSFIIQVPLTALPADHEEQMGKTIKEAPQVSVKEMADGMENEKPLILVAEDNRELQEFLAGGFTDQWKVITAPDGLQAWEMILAEMPDVVVSDVMMPGRDGLELCKLCKKDPRSGHIGFMILTSRAAHEVKLQGLETGADDYIVKPFHLDELQLRISNLLQLQQKQRAFLQSQALPGQPGKELPRISDVFLQQLYQLLDNHLDEPQLNVDFLARSLSMSRSSLNRKLKNLLDISANDLIRRYRLQQATTLLLAGNDISATAYKVGFNTPSYFSQCFREQYGITPSEYVAAQKDDGEPLQPPPKGEASNI